MTNTYGASPRTRARGLMAGLTLCVIALLAACSPQAPPRSSTHVLICHRTTNDTTPYTRMRVTVAELGEHLDHSEPAWPAADFDTWGDIIPPNEATPQGLNWDDDGRPIHENRCVPGQPSQRVLQISTGEHHTCALLRDRTVSCWGDNLFGQLGDRSPSGPAPRRVPGVTGVRQVAAGPTHTCVLARGGTVWCWGDNLYGQLGRPADTSIDPTQRVNPPAVIEGLRGVRQIAVGPFLTCAVLADRRVACWGGNSSGELGQPEPAHSATPVPVPGVAGATQVSAGFGHVCAVQTRGTVMCWGLNFQGQAGSHDGLSEEEPIDPDDPFPGIPGPDDPLFPETEGVPPHTVPGLRGVKWVGAAAERTCALHRDGTVSCWGWNYFGQLGNDSDRYGPHPDPARVQNLERAVELSVGSEHACARLADRTAVCWGRNNKGQLGSLSTPVTQEDPNPTPTPVTGLTDVTAVAAAGTSVSGWHTCALTKGQVMYCWGNNETGQLGNRIALGGGYRRPIAVMGL